MPDGAGFDAQMDHESWQGVVARVHTEGFYLLF